MNNFVYGLLDDTKDLVIRVFNIMRNVPNVNMIWCQNMEYIFI